MEIKYGELTISGENDKEVVRVFAKLCTILKPLREQVHDLSYLIPLIKGEDSNENNTNSKF